MPPSDAQTQLESAGRQGPSLNVRGISSIAYWKPLRSTQLGYSRYSLLAHFTFRAIPLAALDLYRSRFGDAWEKRFLLPSSSFALPDHILICHGRLTPLPGGELFAPVGQGHNLGRPLS